MNAVSAISAQAWLLYLLGALQLFVPGQTLALIFADIEPKRDQRYAHTVLPVLSIPLLCTTQTRPTNYSLYHNEKKGTKIKLMKMPGPLSRVAHNLHPGGMKPWLRRQAEPRQHRSLRRLGKLPEEIRKAAESTTSANNCSYRCNEIVACITVRHDGAPAPT